jgi:MFS family permease
MRLFSASTTYYVFTAGWSGFNAIGFTVALVYYVDVLHLDAFQMVIVGTVLEAACFVFEIPTGVLADLVSRKLSIVIGIFATSAAFLLLGLSSGFGMLLVAQVLWGLGFTFTSGAAGAWVTDEVGEERAAGVFQREQQVHLAATIVGTVAAAGFGLLGLRLPMLVAAGGFLVLAAVMCTWIREDNFTPAPRGDRTSVAHLTSTISAGIAIAIHRPIVRSFLVVSFTAGLASEAFDRLWTVRILHDFELPHLLGRSNPEIWFSVFALVSTFIALGSTVLANRYAGRYVRAAHPNVVLAVLTAIQVVGMLAFAILGNVWLALAALWTRDAAVAIAQPVEAAWLNRNADSQSRATVLSMNSQFNAIGQVIGGPPLGALASRTTVSIGLIVAAGILSPAALIYLRLHPVAVKSADLRAG